MRSLDYFSTEKQTLKKHNYFKHLSPTTENKTQIKTKLVHNKRQQKPLIKQNNLEAITTNKFMRFNDK